MQKTKQLDFAEDIQKTKKGCVGIALPPFRGYPSNPALGAPVGRKRDIQHVDAICRRYRLSGDQEYDFRDYLHECKDRGDGGSDQGDFTHAELIEKLKEFLGVEELP